MSGRSQTKRPRKRRLLRDFERDNDRQATKEDGVSALAVINGRSVDDLDAIQEDLISRGVRYCIGSYVDVHGVTKAKLVPSNCFARMCRGSELYTVGALDGMG